MARTCTRRYLLFQRSYHFKFDTRFSSINRRICIEHQSQGDPIWDLWTMSGQLWANPKAFGSCAATCWEQLGTTKDRGHNCSKCGIELCTCDSSISVISFKMLWFNIFNGSFWVGDLCHCPCPMSLVQKKVHVSPWFSRDLLAGKGRQRRRDTWQPGISEFLVKNRVRIRTWSMFLWVSSHPSDL